MGRQIISTIKCGKCHKEFDVATEDIEWEHVTDVGETKEGGSIHDYGVFQTIDCPLCRTKNKIVFLAKGKPGSDFCTMEVVSLEKDAYIGQ